jgi:hypothetical protein
MAASNVLQCSKHVRIARTCRRASVLGLLCTIATSAQRLEPPRAVAAMNWLDQFGEYFHHPVLASLDRPGRRVRVRAPEYVVEFGGLLVPAGFDCDMFNAIAEGDEEYPPPFDQDSVYPYERWAGSFPSYFMAVPSRWIWCWQQFAAVESGLRSLPESLPVIDEEYPELVAWAHSVMRARGQFVGVDLGARWGTWGARAVAFLRVLNSTLPHTLLYVESNPEHCAGLELVHQLNGIDNYTLVCDVARPEDIMAFLAQHGRVDILDMDIESAEFELLLDGQQSTTLRRMLQERVVRLVIATHNPSIHEIVKDVLVGESWLLISEVPFTGNISCLNRFMRMVGRQKSPEALMANGCYHEHPVFGPISQFDGSLIFDNPAFVSEDPDVEFRFESLHLLVDDLLVAHDESQGPTITTDNASEL